MGNSADKQHESVSQFYDVPIISLRNLYLHDVLADKGLLRELFVIKSKEKKDDLSDVDTRHVGIVPPWSRSQHPVVQVPSLARPSSYLPKETSMALIAILPVGITLMRRSLCLATVGSQSWSMPTSLGKLAKCAWTWGVQPRRTSITSMRFTLSHRYQGYVSTLSNQFLLPSNPRKTTPQSASTTESQ